MLNIKTLAANAFNLLGSLLPSMLVPTDKVQLFFPLGSRFIQYLKESGYFHLPATKPDTIGKYR